MPVAETNHSLELLQATSDCPMICPLAFPPTANPYGTNPEPFDTVLERTDVAPCVTASSLPYAQLTSAKSRVFQQLNKLSVTTPKVALCFHSAPLPSSPTNGTVTGSVPVHVPPPPPPSLTTYSSTPAPPSTSFTLTISPSICENTTSALLDLPVSTPPQPTKQTLQ